MEESQLKQMQENLEYLTLITSKNRYYAAEVSPYFILWGLVWLVGFGCAALGLGYTMLSLFSLVGLFVNFHLIKKQEKENKIPSLIGKQFGKIGISFIVIVSIFIVLLSTGFLTFSNLHLGIYCVFLIGILYMLFGVIFGKEMFVMGIWLSITGTVTAIWFMDYSPIVFAVFGGGSLIGTGFILKRWRLKDDSITFREN